MFAVFYTVRWFDEDCGMLSFFVSVDDTVYK
jgi:hypothetical protein